MQASSPPLYEFTKNSYLVVFDRPVSWAKNVKVMNWVALESGLDSLRMYVMMQCIKVSSTVRLSCKGDKQPPEIVYRHGSQCGQVQQFLSNREFVLSLLKGSKDLPFVVGDWDKATVRLDFDDTPLDEVKLWAFRALEWFNLKGFVILKSSSKTYVVNSRAV